jgi:hypothetical protein
MSSHRLTQRFVLITILCTFNPTWASDNSQLRPADLHYQGAFALPEDLSYGGQALAVYPDGDGQGEDDGYGGSLFVAGSPNDGTVAEVTIPAPIITTDLTALPLAQLLRRPTDITGGWRDNCTYAAGCQYRDIGGLAYLPAPINRLAWSLLDWYNVEAIDQDTLGWCAVDFTDPAGVWHIGPRDGSGLFHNARTSDYLFTAPGPIAETFLQGRTLLAGQHREAGALGGSQGPSLYATAPWQEGNPPLAGAELAAQPLLYYPEYIPCVWADDTVINPIPAPDTCAFPNYRAVDHWAGGAWIVAGERAAVLFFGRKGLGANCYGSAETCGEDSCKISQGYHAYPYQPQILFYDPDDLLAAARGERDPWSVLPYRSYAATDSILGRADCAILGAAAWDAGRHRLYVVEQQVGDAGTTVVHVWDVAEHENRDPAWRVAEIYVATMGYAPDAEGLDYWVNNLEHGGWVPLTVAESFFDQELVLARYPADAAAADFVTALYQNLFGREPDAEGLAYWVAELEQGTVSRNQAIITLIEGGWDNSQAALDMARFHNQVYASLAFAERQRELGIVYSDLSTAQQAILRTAGAHLIADITHELASRETALARIDDLLAAIE